MASRAAIDLKSRLAGALDVRNPAVSFSLFALASFALFIPLKFLVILPSWSGSTLRESAYLAVLAALTLCGVGVRRKDLPAPMRILLTFIFTSLMIYRPFG